MIKELLQLGGSPMHSDHRARDSALPYERARLLRAITHDVLTDPGVAAAFVAGSLATGNEDLYSDIDLRIVVDKKYFGDFVSSKLLRPHRWGPVLYHEDLGPQVAHTVTHFESFIKVDCFYYRVTDLTASHFLKKIRIVHDPLGLVEEAQRKSQSLMYRPSATDVDQWRYKILAYAHEVYRGCMRGELSYARKMLIGIAGYAMAGWHMEEGRLPEMWADWSKAEGPRSMLSPLQQDLLREWHPLWDARTMLDILSTMVPELSRLNRRLSERAGCDPNQHVWEQAWAMVI